MVVVLHTDLPIKPYAKGKVRDSYDLGDKLLMVATDRVSAFDVVMPCGVPGKGHVLNKLSAFWFRMTAGLIPNHMEAEVNDVELLSPFVRGQFDRTSLQHLAGRAMVVRKAERLPVECVVRGYLSGSAWEEYRAKGTVHGLRLPDGFRESQELPEPLFTPTTKAETGHDEPMELPLLEKTVGRFLAGKLREKCIEVYRYALGFALGRGFIIADTKMEFGLVDRGLILIDELLTPDSSRFWDIGLYEVGKPQPSFDKQPLRDWLVKTGWNKEPPAPMLSEEIVNLTASRYREVYQRLTGDFLEVE